VTTLPGTTSTLPLPGELVGGKYRVVRLIGEGGMGVVYEARHEHLGSQVALKFLLPELAERPGLVARFLQEARVSASIKSPHVTHVVDVDQTPAGAPYLVMELLEGESLETRLGRGAPIPQDDAVDIGLQILSALEAAHSSGVIHRDLKPDNVWLSPAPGRPLVKLLDFGIAKLKRATEFLQVSTRPGSIMGTPAYMAPEQAISADQVDARADLYSLGVILYEMLSGKRPVDADEPGEILERLVRGDVYPLRARNAAVPADLAALVDRLVAPNPDARPRSAADARAELSRFARGSGHDGGRASVPDTLPPDDTAAPPFVTATHAVAAPTRTDSMPRMPDLAFAPTAPAQPSPVRLPHAKSGRSWLVALVAAAALAGVGVWVYVNQSVFEAGAPPPLPVLASPQPAPAPAPVPTPMPEIADERVVAQPPGVRERPSPKREARGTPEAPPSSSAAPTLTFPNFPIPIPSGVIPIPSVLPPFFRELPSLYPAPTSSSQGPGVPH
jgi:serine/threonine-protein kinase